MMLLHTDVVPHMHETLNLPVVIAVGVVATALAATAVASILRKSK